jgi:hypothetical protein
VVHYDDIVPYVPTTYQGYQHAGNEVWYKSEDYNPTDFKECENFSGETESTDCSGTFYTHFGLTAHRYYLGLKVSGQCTRIEPGLLGDGVVFEE